MIPDMNRENQKIYYSKDGEWVELNTTKPIELICTDNDVEYVTPLSHEISSEFSFHATKKTFYHLMKALGLIKPVFKRKKKGKRYVRYEIC